MKRLDDLRSIAVGAFFLLAPSAAAAAETACGAKPLIVFAAASMTDAIGRLADRFEERTGCAISVSVAGSSTLARQIAEGAPAGVFVSANRDWIVWLEKEAPARLAGKPLTVARNTLVAVSRGNPSENPDIEALLSKRFAMGDPAHVPAGIYARSAMRTLGIWDDVSAHAVFTENVRVALSLAARGDVGAAIVYSTDARLQPDLSIAYRFDPSLYPEIAYEAVLLDTGGQTGAGFLDALTGGEGRAVLSEFGFLSGGDGADG